MPLNFILLDADHSAAAVTRDLNLILDYKPREPLILLMHDSGNSECRRGILAADWASNPHMHVLECDFVPGQIIEHSIKDGRGEIWGGLALAYFLPEPRTGLPRITQIAASSLRCLNHLMLNIPPIS